MAKDEEKYILIVVAVGTILVLPNQFLACEDVTEYRGYG
jgi:hypothetical protein